MNITRGDILAGAGIDTGEARNFAQLGLLNSLAAETLSFTDDAKYLGELARNQKITGVFVTADLAVKAARPDLSIIVCDDPRYCFYALYNYMARKNYVSWPSVIAPSAEIHPTAFISKNNVRIGANTRVEANATVLADVEIGADCLVGAGAVLGCDDAEVKVTSRGTLRVVHDGRLLIGDRVDVGANSTVDKGFAFRDTIIGDDSKLANTTFVGHAVHVGKNCRLLCCKVLGSATIEDDVRINPGAVIANQLTVGAGAVVSLGTIVARSVPPGGKVSGNFAVDHKKFIYHMAQTFGRF